MLRRIDGAAQTFLRILFSHRLWLWDLGSVASAPALTLVCACSWALALLAVEIWLTEVVRSDPCRGICIKNSIAKNGNMFIFDVLYQLASSRFSALPLSLSVSPCLTLPISLIIICLKSNKERTAIISICSPQPHWVEGLRPSWGSRRSSRRSRSSNRRRRSRNGRRINNKGESRVQSKESLPEKPE